MKYERKPAMSNRHVSFRSVAVILTVAFLMTASAVGQAPQPLSNKNWTVPRTPDGKPDLQGVWSNAIITPLERPAAFANKEFFTEAEAADFEKQVFAANDRDRRDGTPEQDVARAYNDFWFDRGTKVAATRRTSLIIDPKDGKLPAITPEARKRNAERAEARRLHPSDGPEDRPLLERCINVLSAGPPMIPTVYNNNFQIVQTPGYVMILNEMIHDARMVPLDGRPQVPGNVRQLLGSSRGHWDGDTLVVETTNFTDKTNFRGTTENLHLTERFTRASEDILLYEFTVDDPATFTKPWTAQIPARKTDGLIYEYACHEGNEGMFGILSGARAAEKAEEDAKKGSK
jgi:hypothetical protein